MEAPEIQTISETHTCPCGTPFEREVTVMLGSGGRQTRIGATLCPECEESERIERREWESQRSIDDTDPLARMAVAGVNVRKFGGLTLDEMGPSPAVTAAKRFAGEVERCGAWQFVQGLYLAGPTGVGKSQLAVSTLRQILEDGYRGRIVFDRARALITTIQDRYGTGTVDAVIEQRRKAGVWLLDDIGTEKPTADAFRILEDILDSREGHPTILTSNDGPQQLAERWAPQDTAGRLWSRLGPQNYRAVIMDGEDRRFAA